MVFLFGSISSLELPGSGDVDGDPSGAVGDLLGYPVVEPHPVDLPESLVAELERESALQPEVRFPVGIYVGRGVEATLRLA